MEQFRFQRQVREEQIRIKRTESFEASIGQYDVIVSVDPDRITQLSISPHDYQAMRLGLIQCYPKSVGDLEAFAEQSRELLLNLASAMREAGLDDLRCASDKRHDKYESDLKASMQKANK